MAVTKVSVDLAPTVALSGDVHLSFWAKSTTGLVTVDVEYTIADPNLVFSASGTRSLHSSGVVDMCPTQVELIREVRTATQDGPKPRNFDVLAEVKSKRIHQFDVPSWTVRVSNPTTKKKGPGVQKKRRPPKRAVSPTVKKEPERQKAQKSRKKP